MINIVYFLIGIFLLYCIWDIFNGIIFPKIVHKGMTEIERNPKWIISNLQYYGFDDIDIVLCESKWGMLPRLCTGKNNRLELWIDEDTSTKDVDDIGRLALCAKLKIKHGLWFPDKPIYWLSTLLYLLDGGDVEVEVKRNKKPLDQI